MQPEMTVKRSVEHDIIVKGATGLDINAERASEPEMTAESAQIGHMDTEDQGRGEGRRLAVG